MSPAKNDPSSATTAGQETPSYETARDELIDVVRTLEQGGTSLAESLALWERGEELARICQSALDGARERLDRVLNEAEPADPADDGADD